ncbi:hypothetical protein F4823DRAFT_584241 [Ustulina deusta]|nr:hypothetical protein F4823DRAFT_584241 [Ustulina deusta]
MDWRQAWTLKEDGLVEKRRRERGPWCRLHGLVFYYVAEVPWVFGANLTWCLFFWYGAARCWHSLFVPTGQAGGLANLRGPPLLAHADTCMHLLRMASVAPLVRAGVCLPSTSSPYCDLTTVQLRTSVFETRSRLGGGQQKRQHRTRGRRLLR